MKRFLGIVVLGYLWCTPSYAEFIMQDLINVLIETKKEKRADSKVKCNSYQSSKVRPCTTPHPSAISSFSPKNA